jgi:hypothetical protein
MAQVKLPNGALGLIVSSTNEAQQEDLFFPCEPRLFAVNVAGDPECGSLVFDLNGANEPDSARGAYLQSAFRVVKLPLGQPNAIAFQLDLTGQKDTQGGFFCEIMQAPAMDMPAPPGASGGGPSGPGKTVVQVPGQDAPKKGGFGFGEGSHNFGGPFHVGVAEDKHRHGEDADGNPINALHLWTSANFFMNRVADGPIRFELEYKEGDEHDHVVPVHIAWSGADWAAWTTSPFYEPPPPPPPPPPVRPRFGGTIFNGNNPRFDPLRPTIPGIPTGGDLNLGGEPPSYSIFNDNNPVFGPPVDGRVHGSGIPMNLVASLSAVMTPAMAIRPENYNTSVQGTGLFDSGSPEGGSNSSGQESAAVNRAKADASSPITGMMSAFGAQGGFVDAGGSGSGTTHGAEGDPWLYTQVPRGTSSSGKKTSLYSGGTASGGIVYHPPETDLRDLEEYGMVPPDTTLSEMRVICAPGASFGVGIPELATGGINTGANWVYDSDTGDVVWHTYSFSTESEAIRLTNPAQLIRWMSGQSYYGEFSHTNTANQTWTFPDVTATIAAMIFTVAAPASTAPEGTFAWDSAANNLYVNNDGATSWTFVGGASSVTGSGANTRVAYWSGTTTLTSDAGFTFDGITLTLSDSNATTTPLAIFNQASTGDSAIRWSLATAHSYAAGIDNTDDAWKVSYAASGTAVLGTNDRLLIDTSGNVFFPIYTQGSIPFIGASGQVSQDNANFFWDDTNNRLGIGTASPQRQVHIYQSSAVTPTLLSLHNPDTTDGNGAVWSFRSDTTGAGATAFTEFTAIRSKFTTHNHTTFASDFSIFTAIAGAVTERLNITGQVMSLLGSSAPNFLLDCSTAGSATLSYKTNGSTRWTVYVPAANNTLCFNDQSADRIIISNGGNVGLGTTPGELLHLYAASPYLMVESSGTGANGVKFKLNSALRWTVGSPAADSALAFTDTSAAVRLYLDQAGNIVCNTGLATTATDGFLYIPSCAGTPTGAPTSYSNRIPLVVDRTNHKLYFYSGGAWRDAGP